MKRDIPHFRHGHLHLVPVQVFHRLTHKEKTHPGRIEPFRTQFWKSNSPIRAYPCNRWLNL